MVKIALLLSGNIGQFEYEKNNVQIKNEWKNIIFNNNIHVFAYTETNNFYYDGCQYFNDLENEILVTNDDNFRINDTVKFCNHEKLYDIIINKILNCFENNLKNIIIEPYNKDYKKNYIEHNIFHKTYLNYESGRNERHKYGIISQFYKLYKCYCIMEEYEKNNNIKYDIIIRCRFDACITGLKYIDISTLNILNTVYTSYNFDAQHINDFWIIGNREIMHLYCCYYLTISQNLIENSFIFLCHENSKIIKIVKHKHECTNSFYDISDSSEFGLQYIILKNNYFINYDIEFILYKIYKK